MKTVAVCDTEPVAIEGLRSLLQSLDGLRVAAAESSLADTMDVVRELTPDLIVLDKAFGMERIVEFVGFVRESGSEAAVVVWGAAISEQEALRLLRAGAGGVVRKTSSLDLVIECLTSVASGAQWMEEDIVREAEARVRPGRSALTVRESEVMHLVESGLRNKEIAEQLGIRVGTVKIHVKHIFEKTGIRGRYGLALSGLREKGLLTMSREVA